MNRADIERAEAILFAAARGPLDHDDLAWLAARILPRSAARGHRLEQRDRAIRRALAHFAALPVTAGAKALAAALSRAATRPVPANRRKTLDHLLAEIIEKNGGQPIGWRQIVNIGTHSRAPLQ
ncbi:hypothetical protein [Acidiphilium sp.]|uniref:hypothetical protein n=1 Tax=Acidiphilium sp. TaxID=527 RepID=UPI002587A7DF|nr:hypothetical protein [Acidiphilium sp.]